MIKKVISVLIVAFMLTAAFILVRDNTGMILWAYLLATVGLYCGRWFKELTAVCSAIAACFVIIYSNQSVVHSIISIAIFLSVIPIPFYFSWKNKSEKEHMSLTNKKLREKYTGLLAESVNSAQERQKYEESIERIMQLYIIGRDLSKSVFMEDYTDTVIRALLNRTGVESVNIFERAKNEWVPLACSKNYQKNDWAIYMKFSTELDKARGYSIVANPSFSSRDTKTVYWPLKSENELIGCVMLVVENAYSQRYVEEGAIFGSQLSLGAKRVKLFQEISEMSRNDGLTGLYLKRYFMERLQAEILREKRYSGGFYLLMLDIDFFKNVNDKYGHLTGDKVLCAIAKIIADCSRPGDLVGRYGGEEFIVFMPMATKYEALSVAQDINKAVENKKYSDEAGNSFGVTISIGLSNFPGDASTLEQIVNTADKALYQAKQSGRNKVVLYDKTTD